jgi:hypothetical protein
LDDVPKLSVEDVEGDLGRQRTPGRLPIRRLTELTLSVMEKIDSVPTHYLHLPINWNKNEGKWTSYLLKEEKRKAIREHYENLGIPTMAPTDFVEKRSTVLCRPHSTLDPLIPFTQAVT